MPTLQMRKSYLKPFEVSPVTLGELAKLISKVLLA